MNKMGENKGAISRQTSDEGWWASVLNDEIISKSTSEFTAIAPHTVQHISSNNDWDLIRDIYDSDSIVSVIVESSNKGGLLVRAKDIQGFIPVSHLIEVPFNCKENEKEQLLIGYLEKTLQVKIIEWDETKDRVVLSERSALAGEGERNKLMTSLNPGDVVEGEVTNITKFGIFLDIGGVEGLIHISELSWGRVNDPLNTTQIGEKIKAKIINISDKDGRIALSKKRALPNPWLNFDDKYQIGEIIPVRVTKIMSYGVFAQMEEGIEGLIHKSCLGLEDGEEIGDRFSENQELIVSIQAIDIEKRRLSFKLNQNGING